MARYELFPNTKLLDEVAALGMPRPDKVLINHGAALVIRGYRDEHPNGDIDACIGDDENWRYLKEELGFQAIKKVVGAGAIEDVYVDVLQDEQERYDFHRHDFSDYLYIHTRQGRLSFDQQAVMSDQDPETKILVANHILLLLEKLDTGREKDQEAVEAINQALARQRQT